jgi:hypothetical protein
VRRALNPIREHPRRVVRTALVAGLLGATIGAVAVLAAPCRPIVQSAGNCSWSADQVGMPVNFNVGAVSRLTPASTLVHKREPAAPAKARDADSAEVSFTAAPDAAELGLADVRAAVASLRADVATRPRAALAAQANVRPQVAIVIAT